MNRYKSINCRTITPPKRAYIHVSIKMLSSKEISKQYKSLYQDNVNIGVKFLNYYHRNLISAIIYYFLISSTLSNFIVINNIYAI